MRGAHRSGPTLDGADSQDVTGESLRASTLSDSETDDDEPEDAAAAGALRF